MAYLDLNKDMIVSRKLFYILWAVVCVLIVLLFASMSYKTDKVLQPCQMSGVETIEALPYPWYKEVQYSFQYDNRDEYRIYTQTINQVLAQGIKDMDELVQTMRLTINYNINGTPYYKIVVGDTVIEPENE